MIGLVDRWICFSFLFFGIRMIFGGRLLQLSYDFGRSVLVCRFLVIWRFLLHLLTVTILGHVFVDSGSHFLKFLCRDCDGSLYFFFCCFVPIRVYFGWYDRLWSGEIYKSMIICSFRSIVSDFSSVFLILIAYVFGH